MENGIYLYMFDVSFWGDEPKTLCIPLLNNGNDIYVITTNENGFWETIGNPIKYSSNKNANELFPEIISRCSSISGLKTGNDYRLTHITLNCGQVYPSIYRPLFVDPYSNFYDVPFKKGLPSYEFYKDPVITNPQEYSNRLRQLEIILDDLNEVFKVIDPNKHNKKTYGHALRNIIILACTEIDMMMKHILENNHCPSINKSYTTKDYIKLLEPLKLNDYRIGFHRFGNSSYSPFWRWEKKKPSDSIWWYKAYNEIKHDRETKYKFANLGTAINAVMAFAIVLIAQYGYRNKLWDEHVGKILRIDKEPHWELKDFYFTRYNSCSVQFVNYPFS